MTLPSSVFLGYMNLSEANYCCLSLNTGRFCKVPRSIVLSCTTSDFRSVWAGHRPSHSCLSRGFPVFLKPGIPKRRHAGWSEGPSA